MSALAATPAERREDPRVAATIPVQVAFEGEQAATLACVDVSASGMRLRYNGQDQRHPGKLLSLHFELPGLHQPIAVLGVVRWCDPGRDGLMGIHFATGLRAREVWAIQQLGAPEANTSALPRPELPNPPAQAWARVRS